MSFRSTDSGSGLYGLAANLSNSTTLGSPAGCQKVGGYFGAPTPCPLDRTMSWTLDSAAQLADGQHSVTFRAEDVGGRRPRAPPAASRSTTTPGRAALADRRGRIRLAQQ